MFSRVPVGSNIFLEKVSFVTFCLILALFMLLMGIVASYRS